MRSTQGTPIAIGATSFGADHDPTGSHETSEVVHVSRRIVPRDPGAEPDDTLDAKIVAEHSFHAFPGHVLGAGARTGEQTLLGREQCAFTVDIDRSSFEHQVA